MKSQSLQVQREMVAKVVCQQLAEANLFSKTQLRHPDFDSEMVQELTYIAKLNCGTLQKLTYLAKLNCGTLDLDSGGVWELTYIAKLNCGTPQNLTYLAKLNLRHPYFNKVRLRLGEVRLG